MVKTPPIRYTLQPRNKGEKMRKYKLTSEALVESSEQSCICDEYTMQDVAENQEWYLAEDVDQRISELEAEVESDNRELDMAWDGFNRKEAENAALRRQIAELEAKYAE